MLIKKENLKIVLLFVCLAMFTHGSHADMKIKIITCECPPLSYLINDKAAGPSVDIVKNIQKKINTNEDIWVYPWARGYKMAQEEAGVMLFSTTRTKQRENMFKWVGPIMEKRYSLYAKKGSTIKINHLDEAKKYRIGVARGSNNQQFLVSKGFTALVPVTLEEQNLKMLLKGRIGLWYTDAAQSSRLMENTSQDASIEEIFVIQKYKSYFVFNIKTPDNIVKKWQEALDGLLKDGTVLNILTKYKLESLYPE